MFAAAIAALCWSESSFAPPAPSRAAHEFGDARIVSDAAAHIRRHDRGEPVIAPIGMTEAYYLAMGDNYFHSGQLDACDDFVRQHGILVLHSAPIAGFLDSANPLGYALYYLDAPDRRGLRATHR